MKNRTIAPRLLPTLMAAACSLALAEDAYVNPAISHDPHPPATEQSPQPLALGVTYTGDLWKNTQGGLETRSAYLDVLSLTADVDTDAAWGHKGGSFHFDVLVHHNTFPYVGDAQGVSNNDLDDGEHLYEAWYQQMLDGRGSSLKAGLYDPNTEFDHIQTAGLFLNSSQGMGADFGQSGVTGPSGAPLTSMALRGLWVVNEQWRVMAAVLDGVPGERDGNNSHTHVNLDERDGALLVGEINYQPAEAARYGLGSWRYTRRSETMLDPARRENSQGNYAFGDWQLAKGDAGEWRTYLRAGQAQDDVNAFGHYFGTGITYTGHLLKDDDQVGLGVAAARNGDAFRQAQRMAGSPVDAGETAIELTYRTQLTPWLAIQPDVQYIVDPGTDPALDNALAVGVRFEFAYAK